MSSYTFENQGTSTYLVYTVGPEEQLDTTTLGMLTGNKIPGIANTIFSQLDTQSFIKINVSAKIPLNQFFSGTVNKKKLVGVFSGILDAMVNAEDYMIDSNSLLLDQEKIFVDVSTCETSLICLPILPAEEQPSLMQFFKNIMFNTQFDQTENGDYVAKIMNKLNNPAAFSVEDFRNTLNGLNAAPAQPAAPRQQPAAAPAPARQAPQPPMQQAPVQQPSIQQPVAPRPAMQQPMAAPAQNQGFAQPVPPQPQARPAAPMQMPVQQPVQQPAQQAQNDGEKMSLFYLMRHYTKENAEIYKSQNAGKNADKGAGKTKEKPGKE